ncbi:BON domain-containing protein [Paraburkholderia sp.]|jgi:osmotically-inducible protein OsmY|uniref:BON domain-containing protein n=1 Tax=Paraburkholderia sp. TaxID=1926495 RepID=UPI002F3F56FC
MKAFQAIKVVGGALIVLASLNAYAQSSDADAASSMAAPSAKSTKAANRALQRSVRKALSRTKGLSVNNITVRARGGAVTLEGSVPEQPQIDIATQAAQGVQGVTSVKNALTIRPIGQ